MAERHTGAAENMSKGGADESSLMRQNSPFRQLHEGGHHLSHSYKVPAPSLLGQKSAVNPSYMNPLDRGSGMPKPKIEPKVWGKANSVKSMNQQGPGKSGPVRLE